MLCLFFVVPVFSQTASTISEILEKDAASYLDFSYLIVAEAGMDSTRSKRTPGVNDSNVSARRHAGFSHNRQNGIPLPDEKL